MRLSPHFELHEFTRTRVDLPNTPNADQLANLQGLCVNVLEPWRAQVGRLYVTSGFRAPGVNVALRALGFKASATSEHLEGLAADNRPLDLRLDLAWTRLVRLAPELPLGQAIVYVRAPGKGWIHVSYDPSVPYRRDLRVDVLGEERTVPWSKYRGPLVLAA